MTMIEKVARALAEAADEPFDEVSRNKYEGDARAAIEAMKEPTGAMWKGAMPSPPPLPRNLLPAKSVVSHSQTLKGLSAMIPTDEREQMRKLSQTDRDNGVQDCLKHIRENSTGAGAVNHEAINNALDRIEALQGAAKAAKDDPSYNKPNPVLNPGGLGGHSQNPPTAPGAYGTATQPVTPPFTPNV